MRQGKEWGYTTKFFCNALFSAHHLEIKEGGFCSEHKHEFKTNEFYVMSGKLEIIIFRENPKHPMMPEVEDKTILTEGQSTAIPPGVWHKFKGITDVECIEVYHVFLQEPDIERRTKGGLEEKDSTGVQG